MVYKRHYTSNIDEVFFGQYLITRADSIAIDSWNLKEMCGYKIFTHPAVHIAEIASVNSELIGYVIGYFVSKGNIYCPEKIIFENNFDVFSDEWYEENIYSISGRYICIILNTPEPRLYLDPSGSMPCVYDNNSGCISSSPSLISHDLDISLLDNLGLPQSGLYIPFGFTAYKNISRLLPNHYLNISSMSALRHWPRDKIITNENYDNAASIIANKLINTVEAISRATPICVPLTGGQDSRMLLAATHRIANTVEYITIRGPHTDHDTHLTKIIREKYSLNHRYIRRISSSPQELESWLITVGYSAAGMAWKDHATYDAFDRSRILLPSICGEIGRGFFYKSGDTLNTTMSPDNLLLRMKIPAISQFKHAARLYINELKNIDCDFFCKLDLTYNEQRLGSWAGPTELGGDRFSNGKLWPMCSREIISTLHSLPLKEKISGRLPQLVVNNLWPELNSVPYNTFSGPFATAYNMRQKALKVPKYLMDQIRARLKR